MSGIPSGISRIPNLLISRATSGSLNRTNLIMARLQEQLATGLAINRPSDDAVKAATISLINERLERGAQLKRNMEHADAALLELDTALGEATDLATKAREIALSQLNFSSGPDERRGQAVVVQSLIDGMLGVANREGVAGHLFGGTTPGRSPVESFLGGYRYRAGDEGLETDLGEGVVVPITLGASVMGSTSGRVVGDVDLDPDLTGDTRIADLRGARGLGVTLGEVAIQMNGDEIARVDLSHADTVQDVIDALESALRAYESENETEVLGPGGVSISGKKIAIDVLSVPAGEDPMEIVFEDVGAGTSALDLGLNDDDGSMIFSQDNGEGMGLDPRITWTTPIEALSALDEPLGEIRIRAMGVSQVVDLSGAQSVQDLRDLIEGTGLGLRVEIDQESDRLVVVNEVAGTRDMALSIEEVDDETPTAGALGIRTLSLSTPLSAFNDGRGVEFVSGGVDPVSGEPDPTQDIDFAITLGNGFEISVNLGADDVRTVETLLGAINDQATEQLVDAGLDPDLFSASLSTSPNGIALTQDTSDPTIVDGITVEAKNNSPAAWQLGLLDGIYDETSGTLRGEDRATVRPDNVFTQLLDLRTALEDDDTFGISIAAGNLEEVISQLAETRAVVGGHTQRLEQAMRHQEDRTLLDETVRSQIQDLDFVEAASRFSLLQTQLQAGYQSAAQLNRLSLLDFLG